MAKKQKLFEYAGDPKVHKKIDAIISDLCNQYQSENLEADIIALFEDIIQFFSGREEDFIDFDSLSKDQREAIYVEITTIIKILKNLKGSLDKLDVIKILSKNMLSSFSKSAMKGGYIVDKHQIMTKEEQKRIKEEFAKITLNELYKKQQENLASTKTSKVGYKSIEQHVQGILQNSERLAAKFSAKVKEEKSISAKQSFPGKQR